MSDQPVDSRVQAARHLLAAPPMPPQPPWAYAEALRGVIDAYEERLRINVGLVMENAELRKKVQDA